MFVPEYGGANASFWQYWAQILIFLKVGAKVEEDKIQGPQKDHFYALIQEVNRLSGGGTDSYCGDRDLSIDTSFERVRVRYDILHSDL